MPARLSKTAARFKSLRKMSWHLVLSQFTVHLQGKKNSEPKWEVLKHAFDIVFAFDEATKNFPSFFPVKLLKLTVQFSKGFMAVTQLYLSKCGCIKLKTIQHDGATLSDFSRFF